MTIVCMVSVLMAVMSLVLTVVRGKVVVVTLEKAEAMAMVGRSS